MFFVIALTFRSVMQSVLLFLLMPFGFIGVVGGHWLMDKPLSLFSVPGHHRSDRHHRQRRSGFREYLQ